MDKKERIYMGFVYLVGALVLGLLLFFMLRSAGCLDESRLFLPSDVTSFRLQNDGHDFSFSRTGDSWKSANDETFPVDPQKAEAFLEFMAGLPVTKKLSKDADPSSYGLSEPACILTLTLKNGKEKVIRTGGAGEKEGEYCFTFSDKENILFTSGDLSGMGTLSEYDLIAGAYYGFAGALEAARTGSVTNALGEGYQMDAIAACVVGGVSMRGGIGKVSGVVTGVIMFQIINYGMNYIGVNPYLQYVVKGVIILIAVAIDTQKYLKKK